jgi:hypothetical protein
MSFAESRLRIKEKGRHKARIQALFFGVHQRRCLQLIAQENVLCNPIYGCIAVMPLIPHPVWVKCRSVDVIPFHSCDIAPGTVRRWSDSDEPVCMQLGVCCKCSAIKEDIVALSREAILASLFIAEPPFPLNRSSGWAYGEILGIFDEPSSVQKVHHPESKGLSDWRYYYGNCHG